MGRGGPARPAGAAYPHSPGCTPDIVAAGRDPLFWKAAGASLLRVAGGFLAAVAAGCAAAVLTARFSLARALLAPVLHIVRAAPVASFIILALVWFRTDVLPLFIAFLMVVPVVWANVEKGIRAAIRPFSKWRGFIGSAV